MRTHEHAHALTQNYIHAHETMSSQEQFDCLNRPRFLTLTPKLQKSETFTCVYCGLNYTLTVFMH